MTSTFDYTAPVLDWPAAPTPSGTGRAWPAVVLAILAYVLATAALIVTLTQPPTDTITRPPTPASTTTPLVVSHWPAARDDGAQPASLGPGLR